MSTKFVTNGQRSILDAAKALTDSEGFMEDARAIAAYQAGFEGNPEYLKAIIVFEAFRPSRGAEMHFGMAFGKPLSMEIIQMGVTVAFHPKLMNLHSVTSKVPVKNPRAICTLLKLGFEIQYRENNALADGSDVIAMTLTREAALSQAQAMDEGVADPASSE